MAGAEPPDGREGAATLGDPPERDGIALGADGGAIGADGRDGDDTAGAAGRAGADAWGGAVTGAAGREGGAMTGADGRAGAEAAGIEGRAAGADGRDIPAPAPAPAPPLGDRMPPPEGAAPEGRDWAMSPASAGATIDVASVAISASPAGPNTHRVAAA